METVINYYERLLKAFPTVNALAHAEEERYSRCGKNWAITREPAVYTRQPSRCKGFTERNCLPTATFSSPFRESGPTRQERSPVSPFIFVIPH